MTESQNKAKTIWLTGLSGSGKTTIGKILASELKNAYLLDGDVLRVGLNKDLGFSPQDRKENIRRAAELCKIFNEHNIHVIACFISPYAQDREMAKEIIGNKFIEVYIKTPLATCQKRDPKGLYKKVKKGLIKNFTGIDAPYEIPTSPTIEVDTENALPKDSADYILSRINL